MSWRRTLWTAVQNNQAGAPTNWRICLCQRAFQVKLLQVVRLQGIFLLTYVRAFHWRWRSGYTCRS